MDASLSLSISDSFSLGASPTMDVAASIISDAPELVEMAPARGYGRTVTSSFLDCSPPMSASGGVTVHHTTYVVYYPAACATREWMATYRIVESCPKKCGSRHPKDPHWMPPNFVVTTVTCNVCATKTQTITCPNALGTAQALIEGDGVTATVTIDPTPLAAAPMSDPNVPPMAAETPGTVMNGSGADGVTTDSFVVDSLPEAAPILSDMPDSPPSVEASIASPNSGAAASGARVLAGGPAGIAGSTPVVTAGAHRAIGLKTGLTLLTGISVALLSF